MENPEVPSALRPLALGELLDASIMILKARPRAVLGITALFVVPVQVATAFAARDALGGAGVFDLLSDPSLAGGSTAGRSSNTGTLLLLGLLPSLMLPFIAGALARLVAAWRAGGDVTTGAALRAAGRKWWVLAIAWFVSHLAEGFAALVFFVPAILLMALWQVAAPAIVVEDLGPIEGLRRSAKLAGPRFWHVVWAVVTAWFVQTVLGAFLPIFAQVLAGFLGADAGWVVLAVGNSLTNLLTTAFIAGFAVVLYLDLRVRNEGLDLLVDADGHFPTRAG